MAKVQTIRLEEPSDIFKFMSDMDNDKAGNPTNPEKELQIKNAKIFLQNSFAFKYTLSDEHGTEFNDHEDRYSVVGWRILNHRTKTVPSEFFPEGTYKMEFFDHIKKHAKLVANKTYYHEKSGESEFSFLFDCEDLMINFCCFFSDMSPEGIVQSVGITYTGNLQDKKEFFDNLNAYERDNKEQPTIGIIKTTRYGPAVSWIEHKTDYVFSEDNYNEDFPVFYNDLKDKLENNKTGLYLFYGEAGTGKSSAIRQLISDVKRKVVFIPPQMINCLSSPDFTDLVLSSLKNTILVIEDAEKALMKRESDDGFHNSELVSSLLNLTDGLYADLAHTSIIATYNCDRNLIDPALLRKGRLKSEYHFKKLSIDKTQKLMDDLKHNIDVAEPMTLAEIFNYGQQYSNRNTETKRAVGFGG